jgi:hypothetical protein
MNKSNFFTLEIMHLYFIDGTDLLNVSQTSKKALQKYHGKSPLWKFICTSQFDIPTCPCCKPQDYKSYFIKYNKLLNSIDY